MNNVKINIAHGQDKEIVLKELFLIRQFNKAECYTFDLISYRDHSQAVLPSFITLQEGVVRIKQKSHMLLREETLRYRVRAIGVL